MRDNHKNYLLAPLKIGFTNNFIEKENSTIFERVFKTIENGKEVNLSVRYCELMFGDNNEYTVNGIVTDQLCLDGKPGSYSHIDISKTLEKSIVIVAQDLNLDICHKVCSWPFAKVVVTKQRDN